MPFAAFLFPIFVLILVVKTNLRQSRFFINRNFLSQKTYLLSFYRPDKKLYGGIPQKGKYAKRGK